MQITDAQLAQVNRQIERLVASGNFYGQKLKEAPSDGIALIASRKSGSRGLRIPGVIQYCREGEWVRAPASEPEGVKVTFFPFIGSAR